MITSTMDTTTFGDSLLFVFQLFILYFLIVLYVLCCIVSYISYTIDEREIDVCPFELLSLESSIAVKDKLPSKVFQSEVFPS